MHVEKQHIISVSLDYSEQEVQVRTEFEKGDTKKKRDHHEEIETYPSLDIAEKNIRKKLNGAVTLFYASAGGALTTPAGYAVYEAFQLRAGRGLIHLIGAAVAGFGIRAFLKTHDLANERIEVRSEQRDKIKTEKATANKTPINK